MKAFADSHNASGGGTQGGRSSNVFQELLAYPGASIFGLLKLVDPLVDRSIELRKGLLLLENGLMAEFGCTRGPKILANACVKVTSP